MRAGSPWPERIVVIGAGTMGARIALFFARAGLTVCLAARRQETLEAAATAIRSALAEAPPCASGPAARQPARHGGSPGEVLSRIRLTTDAGADLDAADLVVETIREDASDKIALLGQVGSRVRPEALVTTNTSSLDLATLAEAVPYPERFAGLHWFNPADLVELVEVVPAPATAPGLVETLRAWLAELGKAPVVVRRAVPGFVANRLQYALLREAYALVAAGVCTLADADLAVVAGLGPRWATIGPFQSMDIAGLDVHLAVARALFPDLATGSAPPGLLPGLVDAGHLGVKSGRGLLGEYPPDRQEALTRMRDAALRMIPLVREEASSPHPADDGARERLQP
jgi:3-hydroxybutyryl-CoA dehydrogenase